MIRINLLPREEAALHRPAFSFKIGEVVLPAAIVGIAVLVILGAAVAQNMRLSSLSKELEEVEAQSRRIAPMIERVNRLSAERAELDLRLGVINKLQKGRTVTVRTMDELARTLPDHTWLQMATQDGPKLSLEGVTFSNLVVSDFMSRLERSSMFANVELEVAERTSLGERGVVKFRIHCSVTPDEPQQ